MLNLVKLSLLPLVLAASTPSCSEGSRDDSDLVAGKYMVVLSKDAAGGLNRRSTAQTFSTFSPSTSFEIGNFQGFAAELNEQQLAELKMDARVAYIEPQARYTTNAATDMNTATRGKMVTQKNAPNWGLGRLSHRKHGNSDYTYHSSAGAGACVYILDTGLYTKHNEFEGRATFVKRFQGYTDDDAVGHGTHVAGIVAGKTYGVSKKASLFAVKVLDEYGSGTIEGIVEGLQFTIQDAKARAKSCPNGVVVNMSLGGRRSQALNDAVAAVVDAGIFVSVSGGNSAYNVDGFSPASEPKAFTVGASAINDAAADFSNWGAMTDIYAPGVDILSAFVGSPDASIELSGTSMASPHNAGLAAYLLGLHGKMSPSRLAWMLKQNSLKNMVANITVNTATPNFLAFNGAEEEDRRSWPWGGKEEEKEDDDDEDDDDRRGSRWSWRNW